MKAFIRHLMPTKATDSPLSKISRLLRGFGSSLAARPCRRGVYKASLVDCERYVLTCYRYIELNPVRVGMVSDPADYRWSSYRRNAEGGADAVVTEHAELQSDPIFPYTKKVRAVLVSSTLPSPDTP
jgi:hypothetical protein